MTELPVCLKKAELREKLAELEHEQWTYWRDFKSSGGAGSFHDIQKQKLIKR